MSHWIRRFLKGFSDRIDLEPAEGRLPAAKIRAYQPNDFEKCRELFVLNETGRFPPGELPLFESALQTGASLFLVAEMDGEVWGCGAVTIQSSARQQAGLAYGVIHPAKQGHGLGTVLLLARLASLPETEWMVIIATMPAARSFYERFNFREFGILRYSTGEGLPQLYVRMLPSAQSQCKNLLANAGVVIEIESATVPVRSGRQLEIDLDPAKCRIELGPAKCRMRPAHFRPYSPEDFEACRELYILNEPKRFPPGHLPAFEEALVSPSTLFLVLEIDGVIRGCGGIFIRTSGIHHAMLCFGLIHPACHGQGLGTAMLLARLALLPSDSWIVMLSPVTASRGFYERFNFRECGRLRLPTGEPMPVCYVHMSPDAQSQCKRLLADAGAVIEVGSATVPQRP